MKTRILLIVAIASIALAGCKKDNHEEQTTFIAVTNIVDVPTTATAGEPLTLTGTVIPTDAKNKTITWSVRDAGTTNATIDAGSNILNAPATGTVTIIANITNGTTATTPFTKEFNITVLAPSPFSGEGTSESPYLINSAYLLVTMRDLINEGDEIYAAADVYYKLTANINLNSISSWTPIGMNSTNPFKGHFDGDGKTISNLTITSSSSDVCGLFGYVNGGTIQKIGLTNVDINGGSNSTGGVAGHLAGNGSITVCYVTGSVKSWDFAGGIAGFVYGTVSNCYTTCSVSSSSSTLITVGGIAGRNDGTISNCYATGAISGRSNCGGIVGANTSGTVSLCVALNPSITRTGGTTFPTFGRVAGNNGGTLDRNVAWQGMPVSGATVSGDFNDENGLNVNKAQINTAASYELYCPTPPWTRINNRLPGLFGGTVEVPVHI